MKTRRPLLSLALGLGLAGVACDSEPRTSVDALARDMGGGVEGGRDQGPVDLSADGGETARDGGLDAGTDADGGGGDGDAAADRGDVGPPLGAAQSFNVAATVTLTPSPTGAPVPMRPVDVSLMLRIDPVARQLIIGSSGAAAAVGLRAVTGNTFETTEPFTLPVPVVYGCGSRLTVDKLTLDATPSSLTGRGTGSAVGVYGDTPLSYAASLSLSGSPDSTGPSLGQDVDGVDPLDPLSLGGDEPLASGAAARLVAGASPVPLVPVRAADLIVGFVKPAALALRYGSTYQVAADAWSDLAGNAGRPLPKLTTRAVPELSPEDGFEGAGATLGDALVVQAPDYPVLAGKKSVLVTPAYYFGPRSPRFTVRLARAANDVVVRVTLRPLGTSSMASTSGVELRIAVPGGSIVDATLPPYEDVPTLVDGTPLRPGFAIGPARTLEIPLPPMVGPEIVFDVSSGGPEEACGLLPRSAGYLIDDLRID